MARALFAGGAGRVIIDEAAVQSFIRPGGPVANLLDDVAKDAHTYSINYIRSGGHVRSGRMLRGVRWARTKASGPLQGFSRVSSAAKHTIFFHDGTRDGITGHPHLIVPKRRASHTNTAFSGAGAQLYAEWASRSEAQQALGKDVFRPDSVRGQRAKPFLSEGLAYGLIKQRLI